MVYTVSETKAGPSHEAKICARLDLRVSPSQGKSVGIYDDLSTLRCAINSINSQQTKAGQLSASKVCTQRPF